MELILFEKPFKVSKYHLVLVYYIHAVSLKSTIMRTEGGLRDPAVRRVSRIHNNNNINFSYCIIQYTFIYVFVSASGSSGGGSNIVSGFSRFRRKRFLPSVLRRGGGGSCGRGRGGGGAAAAAAVVRNPSAASWRGSIATRCRTADRAEEKLRKLMDQLSSAKLLLSAPRVTDTVWTG